MSSAIKDNLGSMHPCIALIMAPDQALLARSSIGPVGAALVNPTTELSDEWLERSFDVTLFNADRQVRIWHDNGQLHEFALTCSGACRSRADGQQLIWGKVKATSDGWAVVAQSRIGEFDVPVTSETLVGDQLALYFHECQSEDQYGNVTVRATRFLGIGRAKEGWR